MMATVSEYYASTKGLKKQEDSLSSVKIFEFFLVSYLTRSEEISFVITFNFLTVSAIT